MASNAKLKALRDETTRLRDRQDILDIVRRYSHGIDRHDGEAIASIYHAEDAIDDHGLFTGGIKEFVPWANKLHDDHYDAHTHQITSHWCEISGNVAHSEAYVLFVLHRKDFDIYNYGSARYIDRLEKRNGKWGIMLRRIVLDWRFQALGQVDENRWNNHTPAKQDKSDLTYMRPLQLTPEKQKQLTDGGPLAPRHYTGPKFDFTGMPSTKGLNAAQKLALIEKHVGYLRDRREIWDVMMNYARGLDRHDTELLASTFHPDAIVTYGDFMESGPYFAAHAHDNRTTDDTKPHVHHLTVHNCDLKGDVADAETYVLFGIPKKSTGLIEIASCRYIDRLERRNGKWKIAIRRVALDWRFEPSSTLDQRYWYVDRAGLELGQWDKSDLSYMRPLRMTPEKEKELAAKKKIST